MKVLIDQNISHRLKARIASVFPDVFHVKDIGRTDFPDSAIFEAFLSTEDHDVLEIFR